MLCIYSHRQPHQCALVCAEELRVTDNADCRRKIRRWKPGWDRFSHDDAEDRQQASRPPRRPPNTGKRPGASSSCRTEALNSFGPTRTELLVEDWSPCFCPRCSQDSFSLSPNINCVRPEEITVDLRKISGSLGISISVSYLVNCSCFL